MKKSSKNNVCSMNVFERGDGLKNMRKKRIPPYSNKLFPILIFIATIFMSVGYASINSIIMNINGEVIAKAQDGIYITEVNYISDINANLEESKILNAYQTNLSSNIVLSDTNSNSSITYQITMYNSTNYDYVFERIKYIKCQNDNDCDTYSNNNIQINLSIENGQVISSKKYLTFNITFSYVDSNSINSTELKSFINFLFTDANKTYLLKGTDLNAKIKNTTSSSEIDNTVNKIIFGNYNDYSTEINWDDYESFVDEEQLGNIRLYRVKNNDEVIVYILSKNTIYAHSNSARSFMNLRTMKEIEFNNYNTTQIQDMTRMFYMFSDDTLDYSSSLKRLDLSNWDVYNVKNMRAMFGYNNELEYLNISTWETTNCTNMGYVFQELRSLSELNITNFDTSNVTDMQGMFLGFTGVKELDLSSFDTSKVTIMTSMFDAESYHTIYEYNLMLKTIYVSNKFTIESVTDKSSKMFEGNTNLVGGNGTKYSSDKISVSYAIVDNAIYDSQNNYLSGNPGYLTLK